MTRARITRVAPGLGAAATALLLAPGPADAAAVCAAVEGSYVEHAALGPDCTSPVGLCIAGTYRGDIRGDFSGRAMTITSSPDTPTTSVAFFTSDSGITGTARGRSGTLVVKNAGAFTANPDGSIVDLQTVVGGTGGLAGASGSIRASGTFSFAAGGRSVWVGVLCLPAG